MIYKKIAISGLNNSRFNYIKKRFKTTKFLILNDKNYRNKTIKSVDAIVIFAEWPIKKFLQNFFKDGYQKFKKIKWIHFSRAGIEDFLSVMKNLKIKITCGKKLQSINASEHCLALLLYLIRNLNNKNEHVVPGEINGKNVLIIGLGGIGSEIAKKLKIFGANIDAIVLKQRKISRVNTVHDKQYLKKIINNYDIIINTSPLTDLTKNLFNKNIFNKMKAGVFFINLSRNGSIDFKDLKNYLKKNRYGGIGLDLSEDFLKIKMKYLKNFKNVKVTNHKAGITTNLERRFELMEKNIERYIYKKKMINIVDFNKGY